MLNHSLGININKSIIKVSMDIVIVKELDNIIFFVLNVSFCTKTLFLIIFFFVGYALIIIVFS